MSDENFISRWARKKKDAKGETREARKEAGGAGHEAREVAPPVPTPPEPLPPIESLTPESDFSAFMRPGVDPDMRRLAVKKLFSDPRFNVMDGLDVYIDDYSKPDPLPEGWLEKLNQVARLGVYQPQTEEGQPAAAAVAETSPAALADESLEAPAPPVTPADPIEVSQVRQSPPDEA